VATYTFTVHVDAPPEQVFDLWTNLDRAPEWIGGLTRISDRTGPVAQAGTRYTAWFGRMPSRTEVLDADRPRVFATRFGNRVLAGQNRATFEPEDGGTRLTQVFEVRGVIARLAARIFATGSYRGSFRGELNEFVRIAEADARSDKPAA
jgi:uncharacterized protein YndB with AHSA1/START domain